MKKPLVFKCPFCGRRETADPSRGYIESYVLHHSHDGRMYALTCLNPEEWETVSMLSNECGWVDGTGLWHDGKKGE